MSLNLLDKIFLHNKLKTMIVHPKKEQILKEIRFIDNFKEIPNSLHIYSNQISKVIEVS